MLTPPARDSALKSSPEPVPEPTRLSVSGIIRHAIWRGRRGLWLAASTLGFIAHQAGEAAVPVLIGVIIDQAVVHQNLTGLLIGLGALGGVFALLSFSYQGAAAGMVRVFGHGEHAVRQLALTRVLHPRGWAKPRSTGEVLSTSTSDADRVAGVAWSIAEQSATVAALLFASVSLVVISVPLGLAVLVGAVLVLLGMQALARPLERLGFKEQASVAGASEVATDAMAGLRVIRGLGAEQEMVHRYEHASRASQRGAIATTRKLLDYEACSTIVSVFYLGALAFAAAWMSLRGEITVGQLVTVVALAQFLQGSLAHIGTFGANWAHKRASAKRMHGLVTTPYALSAGRDTDAETERGVQLRAEAEAAPGARPAVAPLRWRGSFGEVRALPGRLVGVRVDGAAAARRVSATLALRVPPEPETIFVHGIDATALSPQRYRRVILAPPHDATVFSGTLRDNIYGGDWDERAIAAAALDDVLQHLGHADAELGEGGTRLSGGQRQRLVLARALHEPAEVIVLDEPTTALDPLTEQRVAEGLRGLGRTLIVVSAREALLRACDEVFDLSGAITTMGAGE